jgi:hypothetical protein
MELLRIGRNDLCPCGSGRKFKRCCSARQSVAGAEIPSFERPISVSGDGASSNKGSLKTSSSEKAFCGRPVKRIPVHYTYPEPFGEAECVYCFPVEQIIPLTNGGAVPAEWLVPGMKFRMEDGIYGTITAVEAPRVWEPPPRAPDQNGNFPRRALGTVKHKGIMVIDVTFGGQTVTTTPDHLLWSASRDAWVPVGSMKRGEMLRNAEGVITAVDSISSPRHGFIELHNLEVEEFHNYFVGTREHGSALVHNGQGDCIKKPLQMDTLGNPIPHGFKNVEGYQQFTAKLRSELPPGTQPLFQGSAVTGASYKTGKAFDVGRQSDFDIALAGQTLFDKARALGLKVKDGTRIGPLSPQDLENLGLLGLRDQLGSLAGRTVNFMLFDSIGAALKRPSVWVP